MSTGLRLLCVLMLCHFGFSAAKKPSIRDCKQQKSGAIDCRKMGFLNVPYDSFSFPGVKIYLGNNPYICDCSMVWFLREPSSNKRRIQDYRKMKCSYPDKLNAAAISRLKEKRICATKTVTMKDLCHNPKQEFKHCKNVPKRMPLDIYKRGFAYNLQGEFICDCDIVWLIRRLKTKRGRHQFLDYRKLFCISKRLQIYKLAEERVCPQKEPDHCKVRPNPCRASVTKCINTPKSYECIDVNECETSIPCKKTEVCVNEKKTGYQCNCMKELVRDKLTMECVPPDPCKEEINPCPSTSKCETIWLRWRKSHRCVDIDECLAGTYKCGKDEECHNKENGYDCRCKPGLKREGAACVVNIDPCKARPPPCDMKTQRCVHGKDKSSVVCQDIDECSTKQHDCHQHAKCINTVPGYKCQCKHGFKEYDKGRQCKDLNECADEFRCSKHAKCTNTPGSYKCKCNIGYFGDGKNCDDKNECGDHTRCSVDAECKNKLGTYECVCNKGYHGNGNICKDVNECSQQKYVCPSHSKCINTHGSYLCKCKDGFKYKNGRCSDIDECEINSHDCHKNAFCINFEGKYKCRCKKGYEHLKHGRLCLKVGASEESNSLVALGIAVPICLLLVGLLSLGLYCERRSKRKKRHASSKTDEMDLLLEKQFEQEAQQQQQHAMFMFDPRANMETNRKNDMETMFQSSEEESDYDDKN